jgi:protein-tyrosine phosphatase
MNASETPSVASHCWTLLRALRQTAGYIIAKMNFVRHPYERWATVRMPDSVQSILFVCKGNICRSPLGEACFRALAVQAGRQLTISSAGLETTPGKPAHLKAKAVAFEYGLSLEKHTTTQVHADLLDKSDLIVVMEVAQKDRIHRLYPRTMGKVVLLGRFDSAGPLEIADPYSGTSDDFRSCYQQVSRCCENLAARLGLKESRPAFGQVLPLNSKNS